MPLAHTSNNPFALLQLNPSSWKGLLGKRENGFLIFESPYYGTRAGFINLIQMVNSGKNTVDKVFDVYGDPGAVNREIYKRHVEMNTNMLRTDLIETIEQLEKIGRAIVKMENGSFWVSENDWKNGLSAALSYVRLKAVAVGGTSAIFIIFVLWLLLK